ncbi:probable F-box protein At4g22030 [Juglans microcarpa x Juglans regia]|uniref:probable F-box protein At4g22030 n=1 Tax=Juglans microcarpa x Juglans regia TaxID=2249226 RepID=UPI001B7DECED|nr:probable F-box protein At4g22030 [Juglans microcarpa x Juglans regia]
MASLKASTLLLPSFSSSSSSSSYCCSMKLNDAINAPKLPKVRFSVPKIAMRKLVDEMNRRVDEFTNRVPIENINLTSTPTANDIVESSNSTSFAATQLHAILEAVADRVEMHTNVGQQRDNWNTLLLNSINMITLAAAAMVGAAAIGGSGMPLLALKLSATLLYAAAAGMLLVMNKIQPSQLAEEQRNATRLFKQLRSQIQTMLALGTPTQEDVEDVMERVLALDKAYPLPMLGATLDKFPAKFEPATWWPSHQLIIQMENESHEGKQLETNGWSEELEAEMREIMEVVKRKDSEDYERLGNLVLKINKILAVSGPLLTGIAAVGSACVGNVAWAAVVALSAGALATTVNTFQHGGQVGMVFEMYRNAGGFLRLLKETIEEALEEKDLERRENGELFETKVTLQLGRSVSQLRDLARKSASCRIDGTAMDEFASKLF